MDSHTLTKTRADAPPGFFEAEAAGLSWLADAHGVRTADVIEVEPGRIVLERVPETQPRADAARRFGAALAHTHAAGADAFGAPPEGWDGPLYIGRREMPAVHEHSWGAFYARDRVLPFLAAAEAAGTVDRRQARDIREACELIAGGAFDDDEPPARLHGDLWNGNVLWGVDGVVLIDPAAHGGHRETDLAMLALFGCPYLDDVLAAYDEASPLAAGWRERVPLHQLHPLAVHAAGHGASYGFALHDAALAALALA
ncbi:fructosamine kinase family protein [Microbacterium sp. STN6]|uniref:fructosamine kinase family protein n=1 Tax=Microbacterium sp. STN6 TaxID=2995588 RepID=UPI002260BDE4|nr:fructosamine kinase family protein [Microbacterium sp. STN6]MCX7521276.1 fructosamine kinase family protein [Microbacterium sp. STN6]